MTDRPDDFLVAWWAKNLDELDHEIARLALVCKVKILEPGVVQRVLDNDASACGTTNPLAFTELREMLMMYFVVREKSVKDLGGVQTAQIEAHIIERLKKVFAEVAENGPPS